MEGGQGRKGRREELGKEKDSREKEIKGEEEGCAWKRRKKRRKGGEGR